MSIHLKVRNYEITDSLSLQYAAGGTNGYTGNGFVNKSITNHFVLKLQKWNKKGFIGSRKFGK